MEQTSVLYLTVEEAEEHLSLDLMSQIGEMGCALIGLLLVEVDDDE